MFTFSPRFLTPEPKMGREEEGSALALEAAILASIAHCDCLAGMAVSRAIPSQAVQVQTSCFFTNMVVLVAQIADSVVSKTEQSEASLASQGAIRLKVPATSSVWILVSDCTMFLWITGPAVLAPEVGIPGLHLHLLYKCCVCVCTWLARCNIQTFLIPFFGS